LHKRKAAPHAQKNWKILEKKPIKNITTHDNVEVYVDLHSRISSIMVLWARDL